MDVYKQTPQLWRSAAEMDTLTWFMLFKQALLACIVAYIWGLNYEERGPAEGVRFGAVMGLLIGMVQFGSYAWMPISGWLAIWWLVGSVVMGIGLGLILSIIWAKCRA